MSKISLLPLDQIKQGSLSKDSYVVFGGTFDPIHEGHLALLSKLREVFDLVVVAPATLNPWKHSKREPTDLTVRTEMIRLALAAEALPLTNDILGTGVYIFAQGYVYSAELVVQLRMLRKGTLYWAAAEDIADTIANWRNWEQLQVTTIVVPVTRSIHSTEIREGKANPLPSLANFIKEHKLYGQKA